MNNDLIKRIDWALHFTDSETITAVILDCRAEIERLSESLKESRALGLAMAQERETMDATIERLSKPYVPMTDDEITEATQVAKSDMLHQPTVYCWKTLETAVIARYNEQRGVK